MIDSLYRAVKIIESSDNVYAIRFEDKFMQRITDKDKALIRARLHLHAYTQSIKAYLAFSVGRCQFMIYNLYFIDPIYNFLKSKRLIPITIPYVISDEIEFELFKLFISERMKDLHNKIQRGKSLNVDDLKRFSLIWNGSEAYYDKLVKHLKI